MATVRTIGIFYWQLLNNWAKGEWMSDDDDKDGVESDNGVIINPCAMHINNPPHNTGCMPPLLILGMNLKCELYTNANATSYHSLKSCLLCLSHFQ